MHKNLSTLRRSRLLCAGFSALLALPLAAAAQPDDPPPKLIIAPTIGGASIQPAEPAATPASQSAAPAARVELAYAPATVPADAALPRVELPASSVPPPAIDLTATPDDLWVRVRNGFSMPNVYGDLVLQWQQYYLARPDYLNRIVDRSNRYLYHIVDEIERRGMPMELALLPMVESAYNPMAYSRSHASGIWQFIPSTGKNFRLTQNYWVDQRRDIVASTSAALDYLQQVYEMHGDWQLALASYNWGEGAVARAIAKNKAKGLPADYMSLTMPAETRNYVPKLQALKNIIANPRLYGFSLNPVANRPYFSTIAPPASMDVKVAAKLAEMPVAEFVALNPSFNRPVIPAHATENLVLPADRVDTFRTNLENHDAPLVSWLPYTVQGKERLEDIASEHGITVARLKEVNGLDGKRVRLVPGQSLLVPARDGASTSENQLAAVDASAPAQADDSAAESRSSRSAPAASDSAGSSRARTTWHTVKRGENLFQIARRYDVTADSLRQANKLKGNRIAVGQRLAVTNSAANGRGDSGRGDSRAEAKADARDGRSAKESRVAERGGKGKDRLARAEVDEGKAKGKGKAGKAASKSTQYTIRRGDTLASIARRFDVAVADIQRWNKLNARELKPGQRVTIQTEPKS